MKRFFAALLAMLLIFSAPAFAGEFDHILSLLEDGQYDAAIREIEALRDGAQPESDGNSVYITGVPDLIGADWSFPIFIENSWNVGVTLEALTIVDTLDGQLVGENTWQAGQLENIGLGGVALGPGDSYGWGDGHPVADWFNGRQYVFSFRGDDGAGYVLVFEFDMTGAAQPEPAPAFESSDNCLYNVTAPETVGSDWRFQIVIANPWPVPLALVSFEIVDLMDGAVVRQSGWQGEDLNDLGLGGLVMAPDSMQVWQDGHPVEDWFNGRQYILTFLSEDGEEYTLITEFDMTGATQPMEMAQQQDTPDVNWTFPIGFVNDTESALTLIAVDITDYLGEEQLGTAIFEGEEALANIGLGGVMLAPGEPFGWSDGHPAVDWFDGRVYRFHFRSEAGEMVTYEFPFENLSMEVRDYSQDEGRDLSALRHDAAFEVEVAPGIFWVPASALGESRYTNAEVHSMLGASPEEKQANFSTLYEALQLYQVGRFTSSDDNVRIFDGSVNWEHHKPGYYAVLTNTGCCATDSNWLRYILDGDYDEVGYIAYSQRDGSGHVFSYIRQDGQYYFIDLTHYLEGMPLSGVETGVITDYYATDFILGNVHRTDDPAVFANYILENASDPPVFICMYTATDVPAVEAVAHDGVLDVLYAEENGLSVTVLYAEEGYVYFTQLPAPEEKTEW